MPRKYSEYFTTIYDEPSPIGDQGDGGIGRGGHYSICEYSRGFHDEVCHRFCIIWDEDHDLRVIRFIEDLIVRDSLNAPFSITDVAFIGERKGGVSVFTSTPPSDFGMVETYLIHIAQDQPDPWWANVNDLCSLIHARESAVAAYLTTISNLWGISCETIT